MPVDNIQSKSTESIARKAKGFAQQVLNLVNQALFDGLDASTEFSEALIKAQSQQEQSRPETVKKNQASSETQSGTEDSTAPVNEQKTLKNAEKQEDSEPPAEEAEKPELAEDSLPVEEEPAEQVQLESAQVDAVQSESVAAALISQTKPAEEVKEVSESPVSVEAVEENAVQSVDAATTPLQPAAVEQNKPQDSKEEAAIAPEQLQRAYQKTAQAAEASESKPSEVVPVQEQEVPQDNPIVFKSSNNSDKLNLEANLQQFVAKKTLSENVLASAILVERLQNINAENINPVKTANSSIKIASADSSLIFGQKSSAIVTGTAANIGFSSQNQQDAGQKLDAGKNAKPLTKSQSLSVLEKVEAVMKKIADSKDGSTISLRLDPPQLGSVRADVSLKEGVLHARLTAENPQVLQLLREKASDLQVTLRKMGLEVEKVSISVSSEDYETFTGDAEERQGRNETRQGSFFSAPAEIAELSDSNVLDHWIA